MKRWSYLLSMFVAFALISGEAFTVPAYVDASNYNQASNLRGKHSKKRHKRVRVKVKVARKAGLGITQVITAKAKGPRAKLRGSKFELRVRENGKWSKPDRTPSRFGKKKPAKLRWQPSGEGLAKLRIVVVRGERIVGGSRARKVFIVHPVKVLQPDLISSVPPPGQPGAVSYSGPMGASVGDIVAASVGSATPYGFLGMVTSVDSAGADGTVVQTKPTTLLAALPQGKIDVAVDYGATQVSHASQGVRTFGRIRPVPVKSKVDCTSGASITVEGSASITPRIEVQADWGFFSLDSAQVEAVVSLDSQLSASAEARADCSAGPIEIARYPLPVIAFTVGPVPVVISPQVAIYLAANGSISARVKTSVSGSAEARAGVRYEDGNFSPIGTVGATFDYEPPALSNDASLSASVSPTLEMLIYGVAGPAVFVRTGLDLNAERGGDPWWTLSAPVKAGARLTVPALGLSSGDLTVFDERYELASAESDTDAPPEVQRAVITWDTDGSDVDLHVWDQSGNHAWYSEQQGIEDGLLSSDITTGYGPEVFSDFSGTGRKLTYGLCYFADNGVGPTTVSMDVTDPNGAIRTFHPTLAGTGSSVIVGASPAGGSYSPPPGWCGD